MIMSSCLLTSPLESKTNPVEISKRVGRYARRKRRMISSRPTPISPGCATMRSTRSSRIRLPAAVSISWRLKFFTDAQVYLFTAKKEILGSDSEPEKAALVSGLLGLLSA